MSRLLLLILTLLVPALSQAAIVTKTVEYQQGDARLVGYLAYPKDAKGPLPGVLVIHEWMGLNDYAKRRAEQLAEGAAYNAKADQRSWLAMQQFFNELFGSAVTSP